LTTQAANLLEDCQRFLTEVVYGNSGATDKIIDEYNFGSTLHPAVALFAHGDESDLVRQRYMDNKRVWLEGQVVQRAFYMSRGTYDANVQEGDQLRVVLWQGKPYIVVDREQNATAAIAVDQTITFSNDYAPVIDSGVPSAVRSGLLEISNTH